MRDMKNPGGEEKKGIRMTNGLWDALLRGNRAKTPSLANLTENFAEGSLEWNRQRRRRTRRNPSDPMIVRPVFLASLAVQLLARARIQRLCHPGEKR